MDDKIREQLREIEEYLEACETIHEIETQLIEEKKTREEYAKKKFLKKHDYDKNTDTIDIDGTRVYINDDPRKNIRAKNPNTGKKELTLFTGPGAVRKEDSGNMGRPNDRPTITVDRHFWKLKNANQREAILAHEMKHITHHLNPDNMTKDSFDSLVEQRMKSERYRNYPNRDELRNVLREAYEQIYGVRYSDLIKMHDPNSDDAKKYANYRKYTTPLSSHSAAHENDADAAGIPKVGKGDTKRSFNNINKMIAKSNDKVNNAAIKSKNAINRAKESGNKSLFFKNVKNAHGMAKLANDMELRMRNKNIDNYGKKS